MTLENSQDDPNAHWRWKSSFEDYIWEEKNQPVEPGRIFIKKFVVWDKEAAILIVGFLHLFFVVCFGFAFHFGTNPNPMLVTLFHYFMIRDIILDSEVQAQ